jgi:hypothetical protein
VPAAASVVAGTGSVTIDHEGRLHLAHMKAHLYLFRDFMASFVPPKVKVYKNRVRVTIEALLMQEPVRPVSRVFDLLADGKVRIVSECR